MKSSIKVDFTGVSEGSNVFRPVIKIRQEDSDDPRDGLIASFFQSLGGVSNWLSVSFDHHIINGQDNHTKYFTLYAITPQDLMGLKDAVQSSINATAARKHQWEVLSISRDGNSSKDGTWMHYKLVTNKTLEGLREGILKEAIEAVINNPDNYFTDDTLSPRSNKEEYNDIHPRKAF
jgi:hypothetical protein